MDENKVIEEEQMATPYEKPSKVKEAKDKLKGFPGFVKKHGKGFLAGVGSAAALAVGGILLARKSGSVGEAIQDATESVTETLPFDGGPEA